MVLAIIVLIGSKIKGSDSRGAYWVIVICLSIALVSAIIGGLSPEEFFGYIGWGVVLAGAIALVYYIFESNKEKSSSLSSKNSFQYRVYKNPQNIYKAVKVGWSHPAFFFGFFWCLAKKLWVYAGIIFGIGLVFGVLVFSHPCLCQ